MLVKDLLDPHYVSVHPTDSIVKAWTAMKAAGQTGAVVVTEEDRIVGFITDGDLVRSCMPSETDITIYDDIIEKLELPEGFIKQLRAIRVEHAMQSLDAELENPEVITIDQNESALKALALMFQHRLRRIPVTDGQTLVGTISRGSILTDILLDRKLRET